MFAKIKTIFWDRNASFLRNFEQQSLNPNALRALAKYKVDNTILIVSILYGLILHRNERV